MDYRYYIKISVIMAVIILMIVFILGSIFVNENTRKGQEGERRVARVLKKYSRKHKSKVINDIYLPLYEKTCQIDHIVFGDFGIMVIETKNMSGKITGKGEKLTHTIGKNKFDLYNPNYQNKTHANNLKYHLYKAGIKDIPIYELTVFAGDDLQVSSSIGIHVNQLMEKLQKLPNKNCEYEAMYNIIWNLRITSPIKKFLHKKQKH